MECQKRGKEDIKDLVVSAARGDNSAIETLYQMTYAQGYSVALQIVKNEQDASDLLQDAYITAFQNLGMLTKPESFRSWFNCIVANKCRDWLRKKKPELFTDMGREDESVEFEDTLQSEHMEFSPEEYVDYQETKRLMNDILQNLPEDQRLCILMYYYEELSVQDIAQALDCSMGTVKSRLNYGRNKIKAEVEELKKKGVHLYGVAPIPFLVWMLRESANTLSVPNMDLRTVLLEQSVEGTATHLSSQSVTDGTKEAIKQVAEKGIKHASVAAVKKTIATKVIAGIVGISVVGGTVMGVPKVVKHVEQDKKAQVQQEADSKKSETSKVDTKSEEVKDGELTKITLTESEKEFWDEIASACCDQFVMNDLLEGNQIGGKAFNLKDVSPEKIGQLAARIAIWKGLGEDNYDGPSADYGERIVSDNDALELLQDTMGYPVTEETDLSEFFGTSDIEDKVIMSYHTMAYGISSVSHVASYQINENEQCMFFEASTYENSCIMKVTVHKNTKSILDGLVIDTVEYVNAQLSGWAKAYLEYANEIRNQAIEEHRNAGYVSINDSFPTYALVYVDDDDIPEMIHFGFYSADSHTIISYTDGQIEKRNLHAYSFAYMPRSGKFASVSRHMGEWVDIFKLENGEFIQLGKGQCEYGDNMYERTDLQWDGKSVDESTYKENIESLFSGDNIIELPSGLYEFDEFRKQIIEEELVKPLLNNK